MQPKIWKNLSYSKWAHKFEFFAVRCDSITLYSLNTVDRIPRRVTVINNFTLASFEIILM